MSKLELIADQYGLNFDLDKITKLRIYRADNRWLVEYRRQPRWFLNLDRWWWFDDGTYLEYADASKRIDYLIAIGYVSKTRFQRVKVFEVE